MEWPQWVCPPTLGPGRPHFTALLCLTSSEEPPLEEGQDTPIYTEFDEDFEEEPASPIGHCVAIYHFEGEHQLFGWRWGVSG